MDDFALGLKEQDGAFRSLKGMEGERSKRKARNDRVKKEGHPQKATHKRPARQTDSRGEKMFCGMDVGGMFGVESFFIILPIIHVPHAYRSSTQVRTP